MTWVLIPTYNNNELTQKCLHLVGKNAGTDHKVLVVDDGSDKPFSCHGITGDITILRSEQNEGFTKAINRGLKYLRTMDYQYVCLLNNDTEPLDNFLSIMKQTSDQNEKIGIVGAAQIQSVDPWLESGYALDLTTGVVLAKQVKGPCNGWPQTAVECTWMPFYCVLLSQRCIEYVGLLDEKLKNHCSDNDYCIRSLLAGFAVVFEPDAKVIHHQNTTVNQLGIQPHQDGKWFMGKWFGPAMNELFSRLPLNAREQVFGHMEFTQFQKESDKDL